MADVTRTIHVKVSTFDPAQGQMIPVRNATLLIEDNGWLCGPRPVQRQPYHQCRRSGPGADHLRGYGGKRAQPVCDDYAFLRPIAPSRQPRPPIGGSACRASG